MRYVMTDISMVLSTYFGVAARGINDLIKTACEVAVCLPLAPHLPVSQLSVSDGCGRKSGNCHLKSTSLYQNMNQMLLQSKKKNNNRKHQVAGHCVVLTALQF